MDDDLHSLGVFYALRILLLEIGQLEKNTINILFKNFS